jgi:hypothetical protein
MERYFSKFTREKQMTATSAQHFIPIKLAKLVKTLAMAKLARGMENGKT